MDHAFVLIDTVCLIAGSEHLLGRRDSETVQRLRTAIADHDTAALFEALLEACSYRGISDSSQPVTWISTDAFDGTTSNEH
jgi:hypothetical protein